MVIQNRFKEDLEEINCILKQVDKNIHEKSRIMAGMLNGSVDWSYGCYLKDQLDSA